jgi:iron complex transport system substrate-binding protein
VKLLLKSWLVVFYIFVSAASQSVTVQDEKGTFHLNYIPQRIVVLEYSFVDALASVGVSPVGIADDKDSARIINEIKDVIGEWTSVGTRSQPSLEVIASLKPDLIIADIDRHEVIYKDLNKIAPTLILPSRHETYQGNLKAAAIIGKVLNKDKEMQVRLTRHKKIMDEFAKRLPRGREVQFGIALEGYIAMHPGKSYVGSLIQYLGMKTPNLINDQYASVHTGLEQLLAMNPEYLIIGHYNTNDIVTIWRTEYLWSLLQAVHYKRVYHIENPGLWSRSRGIIAAEIIADKLVSLFNESDTN